MDSPFGPQGTEYAARCEIAGRNDPENFPKSRSNRQQHQLHVEAMASIAYEDDRRQVPKFLATAWAQDMTGGYEIIFLKGVTTEWEVKKLFVDVWPSDSKGKTGLGKAEQCLDVVLKYCGGDASLASQLRQSVIAWCTDGEAAEVLAGTLSKPHGVFPKLVTTYRCMLHSSQRTMEKCLESDKQAALILDRLVTRFSPGDDSADLGSLARGLRSSPLLLKRFEESELKGLDSLSDMLKKTQNVSFAQQRFSTMVDALRVFILRIRSLLDLLICLRVERGRLSSWASRLLDEEAGLH